MRGAGQADVVRKLREIDKRAPDAIEAVIRFSQEDSFWSANILSMPTLRDKWDRLVMKARRERTEGTASRVGAHPTATPQDKEINKKLEEFLVKLWDEAKPEIEAARGKGRRAFEEVSDKKEREISAKYAAYSRQLRSEVKR